MNNIKSSPATLFSLGFAKIVHKMEDRITRNAEKKWTNEGVDLTNVTFVYHNH